MEKLEASHALGLKGKPSIAFSVSPFLFSSCPIFHISSILDQLWTFWSSSIGYMCFYFIKLSLWWSRLFKKRFLCVRKERQISWMLSLKDTDLTLILSASSSATWLKRRMHWERNCTHHQLKRHTYLAMRMSIATCMADHTEDVWPLQRDKTGQRQLPAT